MGSNQLGFIFNNEMGDFNPEPGVTTTEGQIGTPPNIIKPEKRMLSSMTPAIVTKAAILNILCYDMRIDKAIETLKIHEQWLPYTIIYEKKSNVTRY